MQRRAQEPNSSFCIDPSKTYHPASLPHGGGGPTPDFSRSNVGFTHLRLPPGLLGSTGHESRRESLPHAHGLLLPHSHMLLHRGLGILGGGSLLLASHDPVALNAAGKWILGGEESESPKRGNLGPTMH